MRTVTFRLKVRRTCFAAASTLLEVGEGVRAGVAGPELHVEALAGVHAPRRQRVESVALLPGGSRSLFIGVRGDQGAVHVDDRPARQLLPSGGQPRESACGLDQLPHVPADPGPGLRDPRQRPVIGQVQGPADRGIGRRRPEHRRELAQHLGVGHRRRAQRDRDRRRRQRRASADLRGRSPLRQGGVEFGGQSHLVGELAQQDPAGMADQAVPAGSDLQGMVPPVKLHGEKRSSPVDCKVVVTRNLPGPGRFSLLKQARDGRFAAVPSHYRDPQIAPHP